MKTFKRLGINVTRTNTGWRVSNTEYTGCNKGEAINRFLAESNCHAFKEGRWVNSSS